jgi:alkylated DNA repair dioxygenase AlkB
MQPNALTPVLKKIKSDIENESNATFSTVLLNLYRDGNDSNGWHSDNEKELGEDPIIASLSFGEKRVFHLKHKKDPTLKYKIELEHGSLLLMGSGSQTNWKHQLPKSKRKMQPRINLTFRNIVSII